MKVTFILVLTLVSLRTGDGLRCYNCVGECSVTISCSGSCTKTIASAGSSEGVVRSCSPLMSDEGCRIQTVGRAKAEVCFCNSEKCNNAAAITLSLPLLGLAHIMNRFF
ncbi:uncharacterized protein LOC122244763 [Penaeus japonicus]|uniref:uncharacterized protein LOC122244763 n=1 Tax=Penaeus japonicus TaxID=27405 RepID=UPI001C71186B|nr:uncharacterized protein LOC122244763 [Penaeus japonicus]XP_042858676.1 uncharacterized protein LOC122244763 [Penaeus japonicus]